MKHSLATWVLPLAMLASCAIESQSAPSTPVAVQPPEEVVFQKPLPFLEKVVVLRQEAPVEPPTSNAKETASDAKTGLQPLQATCTRAGRYSVFRAGANGRRQLLWRKTLCEAQTFDFHGTNGDEVKVQSKPKFFDVLVEPGNTVVLYEPGSGPLLGEVVNVGPVKQVEQALG